MKITLTQGQCEAIRPLNEELERAIKNGSGGAIICQVFPDKDNRGGTAMCCFLNEEQVNEWWAATGRKNPNLESKND